MRYTLLLFSLFAASVQLFAQLKVTSTGKVAVTMSSPVTAANLSVGYNDGYNYSLYGFGAFVYSTSTKSYNIGVASRATTTGSNRCFGIQGLAGGSTSGYNFGVLGGLADNTQNGAGIFGTLLSHTGKNVGGRYAGYFEGPTVVYGTLTATSVVTTSDMRLKNNVVELCDEEGGEATLGKLQELRIIHYNYVDSRQDEARSDTASLKQSTVGGGIPDITADRHYGVSAQQLKELYPDLVKEGQDGYLAVNYIELVPVLIRAIQELKAEVDELRGANRNKDAQSRKSGGAGDEEPEIAYRQHTIHD